MGTVIDSSWLIQVERSLARDQAIAVVLPSEPYISAVTVAELRIGLEFADDTNRDFRKRFIDTVLQSAVVLPFGLEEAIAYASIAAHLRRTGQAIGERDLIIAATAVANGHSVVTLNEAEFARVPGLPLFDNPLTPDS